MADAYMSTTVESNGFGDIFIPQTGTMDIGAEYTYFHYLRGVPQPMSVIDISSLVLNMENYDVSTAITELTVGKTWDQVNTEEYLGYINEFKDHTVWLWGSMDKGGFYIEKYNDQIRFGISYGFVNTVDPNVTEPQSEYQYLISSSGYYYANQLAQIGISFEGEYISASVDEGFLTVRTPIIRVFTAGPISLFVDYKNLEGATVVPPQPTYGASVLVNELISPTSVTGGEEIFGGYFPERLWLCNRSEQLSTWVQNRDIIEWQGSWSGSKEINTGIDPYSPGGTSASAGGPGSYPTKSDTTLPENPNASGTDAIGTGFVELYNPTKAQVKSFNDYLFSESITEEISKGLKKLIADPIDYIIFIAMCHFQPNVSMLNKEITFCGLGTGVFAPLISNEYQIIDYGTIQLNEPTASFMDYSPFSKASIYVPYVGFRDLPIDEIMGGAVGLKYHVDLLTGSFIAQVSVTRPTRQQFPKDATPGFNTLIAQYEGNCFEFLPVSSTDFRNMFSGMLTATGGLMSLAGGNIGGLGAMASGVLGMKSNVNRSGQASSAYGYMAKQEAFILLSRPFQSIPYNFGGYEGYPSNMSITVAQCSGTAENNYNDGYVETDPETIWGNDITYTYGDTTITAFDDEIAEIKELFDKGVIVNV